MKKNIAIVTTHPIQYQIPLFKSLINQNLSIYLFFWLETWKSFNKKRFGI